MINSESHLTRVKNVDKFVKKSSQLTFRSQSLKTYSHYQNDYYHSIFTQDIEKVIRSISMSPALFQSFRSQPIYMLISETVHTLLMTLLESIVFTDVLLKNLSQNCNLTADVFFIFIGLTVKKFFSTDLEFIFEYLKTKMVNLREIFEKWETASGIRLNFTVKELNKFFKKFRKGVFEMNLNYSVDKVIQISPPYQIENKKSMEMVRSDFKEKRIESQPMINRVYAKVSALLGKCELLIPSNEKSKAKDEILLKVALKF